MAVKRFKSRKPQGERIEFELSFDSLEPDEDADVPEGQEPPTKTVEHVEIFHSVPEVPGKWLLEIGASMAGDDGSRSHAINNFLNRVIVDEDKQRWDDTLQSTDNIVDIDLLADITNWLMEEYGERPTEQSKS